MASKPLCLVSVGHQARRRETSHSTQSPIVNRANRNGNSSRGRNGSSSKPGKVPLPSSGKFNHDLMPDDRGLVRAKKKGKSINHLLDFQSYERSGHVQRYYSNQRKFPPKGVNNRGKEDYVQSTGQFVVIEDAQFEHKLFNENPNLYVPWKYIEAIKLYSQELTNCPICLSPPIAAKAGRCGHAHCYSCILHLICISEEPQCPICHCDVSTADLRSIISGNELRPKVNDKIEVVKMRRSKDSINPVLNKPESCDGNWLARHQRLIRVKADDIIKNILEMEEVQIVVQRTECEDSEIPHIEQALEMLKERTNALLQSDNDYCDREKSIDSELEVSSGPADVDHPGCSDSFGNKSIEESPISPGAQENDYYFYQCSSGSSIYISSLNAKCLMNQYGSLKTAPESLSATVLEIEDFTMDCELRRRFRYLSHLSDGQPFSLVLLDSNDLKLDDETYLMFKDKIISRKNLKVAKDKEEMKNQRKIQEYYDREIYGKYAAAEISLNSQEMFPNFDPDLSISPPICEETNVAAGSPTWIIRSPTLNVANDYFPSLGTVVDEAYEVDAIAKESKKVPLQVGQRQKRGQKKKKGTKMSF